MRKVDTEVEITLMLIYTMGWETVCDYVCILFLHTAFIKSCSSLLEVISPERRNISHI